MKSMKTHEDKPRTLKEKVAHMIGKRLCKASTSSRCQLLPFYESNLSHEMIQELLKQQR